MVKTGLKICGASEAIPTLAAGTAWTAEAATFFRPVGFADAEAVPG